LSAYRRATFTRAAVILTGGPTITGAVTVLQCRGKEAGRNETGRSPNPQKKRSSSNKMASNSPRRTTSPSSSSSSSPISRLQNIANHMSSTTITSFPSEVVPQAPEDALFGLMRAYKADSSPDKVDLVRRSRPRRTPRRWLFRRPLPRQVC
jgi:hypothetical protein